MPRKLQAMTPETTPFWTGGANGELLIHKCVACGLYIHPPQPICRVCRGETVPTAVSGRGRVVTYTINYQPWTPELSQPYAIAIVELVEQADLRFVSNIVGCPPTDTVIGMPVRVVFERHEDTWLPLFQPDAP